MCWPDPWTFDAASLPCLSDWTPLPLILPYSRRKSAWLPWYFTLDFQVLPSEVSPVFSSSSMVTYFTFLPLAFILCVLHLMLILTLIISHYEACWCCVARVLNFSACDCINVNPLSMRDFCFNYTSLTISCFSCYANPCDTNILAWVDPAMALLLW